MCSEQTTTYKERCKCKRYKARFCLPFFEKNQEVLGLRDLEEEDLPDYEQLCPSFLSEEREPLGKCKMCAGIPIEGKEKRRTGEKRRGEGKGKSSRGPPPPYDPSYYIEIFNTPNKRTIDIYRGVDKADEWDRRDKKAVAFNRCQTCGNQLPFSPAEARKAIEEGSKKYTKGTSQAA